MSDENKSTLALPMYFDPAWRAASPRMQVAVNQFIALISELAAKGKKLRPCDVDRRAAVAEKLFCNIAIAALLEPRPPLAVYRHKSSSKWYPHYGASFLDILDACITLDLIVQKLGYLYSTDERSPTLIEPTAALLQLLPNSLSLDDLHIVNENPLILRSDKDPEGYAETVPLKRTRSIADLTAQVNRINRAMREHSYRITRIGPQLWATQWRRKTRVWSVQHNQLQRVFNNGSINAGGRLHGAWWMPLSKGERFRSIRIDDETIVELDFSQLHLRLAYSHFRIAWPFNDANSEQDAYTVHLPNWNPYPDEYRAGCKTLTNALLAAPKPLRAWPGDSNTEQTQLRESLYAIPLSQAVARMKSQHPLLPARAWECGLGHALTRMESDIVVQVLLECERRRLVVLQIYDALLCKDSDMYEVGTIMQAIAKRLSSIVPMLNLMDKYAMAIRATLP